MVKQKTLLIQLYGWFQIKIRNYLIGFISKSSLDIRVHAPPIDFLHHLNAFDFTSSALIRFSPIFRDVDGSPT